MAYKNNTNRYNYNKGYNSDKKSKPKAKNGCKVVKKEGKDKVWVAWRVVRNTLLTYLISYPKTASKGFKIEYQNSDGNLRRFVRIKITDKNTGTVNWSFGYEIVETGNVVSSSLGLIFAPKARRKETTGQGGVFRISNN